MKTLLTLLLALALFTPALIAQEKGKEEAKPAKASETPFFGNTLCPIAGKKVDRDVWAENNGERIYVCCMKCKKKTEKNWDATYAKAYPKDKVKDLKNERCPIMSSRKANPNQSVTWQGHKVRTCCKRCIRKFKTEPNKYLTLLTKPEITQVKNTLCPVMEGEKIEPDVFVVYKKKLVNLCCDSCIVEFTDDADAFLAAAEKDAKKKK